VNVTKTHTSWLVALIVASPFSAAAQVPRFEQNSSQVLSGLRARDVQTRLASASALQKARADDKARDALASSVLSDPDTRVRQAAAIALAKMGGPKAKQALTQAGVCDPDPTVRNGLIAYARRSKLQCHQQPDPADVPSTLPTAEDELIATLGHPLPFTRLAAARELVRRRSTRANKAIWALMSHDPCSRVRAAAVRMLARSYGQQLLPALEHALKSDPDARVREVVLEALAFLRAPKSVPWIAASARAEVVPQVQTAAVNALARFGDAASVEALVELADGAAKGDDARAAAVAALTRMTNLRARTGPLFARVLKQDKSGKVRAAAMFALSSDNSAVGCKARADRLRDPDAELRRAVVEQLARCPAQVARPALIGVLKDDREPAVRRAAAELLIKAGAQKSFDALGAALARDKDVALRKRCLAAIAALAVPGRSAPLCEAAKNDPDPEVRRAAVMAMDKLPADAVVPAAVAVLGKDRVVEVRLEAVRQLSRHGDATGYQALQKAAASDRSAEVRKAAAAGAAASPARRAFIEGLLPQLINSSSAVRLKAAAELCKLAVPSTYRALLLALLSDETTAVRAAVARCFADLDHPLIDIGLSVAHTTDSDSQVVHAVEAAQRQRVERQNRLLQKAKSKDPAERAEAARGLQPSPSKQVRDALELLMEKDPELAVRRAAMSAVAGYQDRRALERLNACSQQEKDPMLRQAMMQSYNSLRASWGSAKGSLNINSLILDLKSAKPEARVLAAQALQVMRDRRAFQALREAAGATDSALRHAAILALGTFGDQAIISQGARTEKDKAVREALIQLNYLRGATPEKIVAALGSRKADEVRRGVEAAAIKTVAPAVPWLVRVAMSHVDAGLREAAVRSLALYDSPLAHWAVRVAAVHDASKRTRSLMWRWAVHTDSAE
jgi:HEAT repeat protein